MGPSISAYNDQASQTLDLATFLDYMVAQHIHLDALSWHEVGARASPAENPPDPQSVPIDVARARALVAARPQIGLPAIVINEYASVITHLIPGWAVGWISALEQAGVTAADRACWSLQAAPGQQAGNECFDGGLDGLLVPGSGSPQAVYWVHRAYAQMTGTKVDTSSPDAAVSAFATRDGASTLSVIVGRHASCTPAVRPVCPQPASATPPPAAMELRVMVPWPAARVTVQRIPNQPDAMASAPSVVTEQLGSSAGVLVVSLPSVADGDAYSLTLTAA
jgi:hypothetical protein